MPNIDGDVKIRVSLDSKSAEKGADRVKRKMDSLAKRITRTFSATARQNDIEKQIAGYEEQARAVEKTIRAEQERISLLKRLRKEVEYDPKARETVDQMGITDLDQAIDESYKRISDSRKEIRSYNAEIRSAKNSMDEMAEVTNPVAKGIKRLGDRMNALVRRVFVFSIILRALRAMKDGLMNLLLQDAAVSKSMAQIKGSLYAAFMPIYNVALPAIRGLLNWLAKLVSAIASIMGTLFGVNVAALANANALKQQAGATSAAGSAAKKAARQLAAFDEINQMNDDSTGGGGGSGGGVGGSWDFSGLDNVSAHMQKIAKIVLAIGAGIAAWKIGTALGWLKDAGIMRNLSAIGGIALLVWAAMEYIVPGIQDIIQNGASVESILKTLGGIFLALAGVSFITGSVAGGLGWVALGIAAIAAANWDKIKDKLGEWQIVLEPIVNGFKEIADLIVKIGTEGFTIDILADIGDMSFTSTAIATAVTTKLLNTIAGLFKLGGKVGLTQTGGILLSLGAAIDIVTDAIDIAEGNTEDRSEKIKGLIAKLLFGTVAGLITVAFGGGAFALMYTVPIAIRLATRFLDEESTKEMMAMQDKVFSGDIEKTLEATKSLAEIQNVLSGFTGLNITSEIFENIFTPEVLQEFETGKRSLEEMQYLAADWMYLFYNKSGTQGLEAWLETFGISVDKTTEAYADLGTSAANAEKVIQKANETTEKFSDTIGLGEDSSKKKGGLVGAVEDMLGSSATLQTDFDSVETSLGNVETAADGVSLAISEDVTGALTDLNTEATNTADSMTSTFGVAAIRIKSAMTNNFKNIFKSFSSGGTIFKGIETGIGNVFKGIVNDLIDGINNVLTKSFATINSGLLRIKNTNINNSFPFSGLSTITLPKIPKLAEGAVIPANHEFLAILGDQKNGTNIEAPLETIVEAVMIAMARAGMNGGNIATAVKSALQGLSIKVGKKELGYIAADAINANRRSEGKLALNL